MLPFFLFIMSFAKSPADPNCLNKEFIVADTMPSVCHYLPPKDIEALQPFQSPLSKSFPEPNEFETYSGCHYQFFTNTDKAQLAVRLIKWSSRQEVSEDYKMQIQRHFESWGITPERLNIETDSAYFSIEPADSTKCDECGVVAIEGVYAIYKLQRTIRESAKSKKKRIRSENSAIDVRPYTRLNVTTCPHLLMIHCK